MTVQNSCQSRCRGENANCSIQEQRDCKGQCSPNRCDGSACQSDWAEYIKHKKNLAGAEKAFSELEGRSVSGDNESPLEQTQKKRKDMQLFTLLGAGASTVLTYKAFEKCMACCYSKKPTCCGQCVALKVLAAAGWAQTKSMHDKSKDLKRTETALCNDDLVKAGVCGDGSDDSGAGDDKERVEISAGDLCPGIPPEKCIPNITQVPPGQPVPTQLTPGETEICLFGGACLGDLGDPADIGPAVEQAIGPPGGWNGKNPFDKAKISKGFGKDKLTAKQKKEIDSLVNSLNRKGKALVAKYQKSKKKGKKGGALADGAGSKDSSSRDLTANFTGGEDALGPLTEIVEEGGGGKKPKKRRFNRAVAKDDGNVWRRRQFL